MDLTVSAGGTRALLELAVSKGASRAALLERSGIDPARLHDRDDRIPFAQFAALMRAGQALCGDPALGLHFGEAYDVSEFAVGCVVGGTATSLEECVARVNRYAPLTVETRGAATGDRYEFSRAGGQLWLVDTRANPNDFPELTESSFARMVCSTRRTFGERPLLRGVHVTHPAPSYHAEYDRIFRVPVTFASDRNALLLDDSVLSLRPPRSSPYVNDVLEAHAEMLLERLERSRSTRGRVESLLAPMLHTRGASVDTVARAMGLSRSTLFRRLKAEGVTFEQVLDELRHRLALHYLGVRQSSVNQTACLLGFSDPAAFSRAFKRWTGSSPRAYVARSNGAARGSLASRV